MGGLMGQGEAIACVPSVLDPFVYVDGTEASSYRPINVEASLEIADWYNIDV